MASSALSNSPYLRVATGVFGTIFLGFGVYFTSRPRKALEFFEFEVPQKMSSRKVADGLALLYAVRDIFMAVALYAAAYYDERNVLGLVLLAGSGVAFVDGFVCKNYVGKGEWNHWSYAPVLAGVGSVSLGLLDQL